LTAKKSVEKAPAGGGIAKWERWVGWVMSGWAVAFCLVDGILKLIKPSYVVITTTQLGFAESQIAGIGLALLVCTVLYAIPQTALFGAILLTGYLGGAAASNIRIHALLFNISFPFIFALLIWGGLWLRDPRLRQLLPLRRL
jgi:hypothetical protein